MLRTLRGNLLGASASCNAISSQSEHKQWCLKNCHQISNPRLTVSEFVEKEVSEHTVTPDHIINMDEVPPHFWHPCGLKFAEYGQKRVNLVTTSHEKSHFKVVLAYCGDGSKLPPLVIFQMKNHVKNPISLWCRRGHEWECVYGSRHYELLAYKMLH